MTVRFAGWVAKALWETVKTIGLWLLCGAVAVGAIITVLVVLLIKHC